MSAFDEKVAYFKEKQSKIMELKRELDNQSALYKAELKAWAGITDGETMDVVTLLEAVKKTVLNV